MKKINLISTLVVALLLSNVMSAMNPTKEIEPFDINSIEYIEDEISFDLGFDTADYLPEGFNPYTVYVNLETIIFIEEEVVLEDLSAFLPDNFDAYAYATSVAGMHYIDENDTIIIDFDTKKHLPEGFNPYIK